MVPERARLVVLTDLLGDPDRLLRAVASRAAAGGETIVVHLLSRAELSLPESLTFVADPEDPTVRRSIDGSVREQYEANYSRFIDDQSARLNAIGVRYVRVVAEDPAEHAVRRIVAGDVVEGVVQS
jgi:hypothetical protein